MPPTSGPIATAAPAAAPQIPNAIPRSFGGNSCASSASEVANIIAPPIPCTPLATSSTGADQARPHTAEETVNTASPTRKTRRLPTMSDTDPAVSSAAASVSA